MEMSVGLLDWTRSAAVARTAASLPQVTCDDRADEGAYRSTERERQ